MKVLDTQTNHVLEVKQADDRKFVTLFDYVSLTSFVKLARWFDEDLFNGRFRQV